MKRMVILGLFAFFGAGALAQTGKASLSYDQYKRYALGGYLNTPLSHLRLAGVEWQSGDTVQALREIRQAVGLGLFDSSLITGNASLRGLSDLPEWKGIRERIGQNMLGISRPEQLRIEAGDVYRFIRLYPRLLQKNGDAVLWKEYIVPGSMGLRTFFNVRMNSRPDLVLSVIRKHRDFYGGLQKVAGQLPSFNRQLMAAAQKLEALYPDAIYPPVYFLVGNLNAAGTADGGAGQLMGLEFFSDYPGRRTSELSPWEKSVLSDTSRLVGVVVHELIHVQQKNGGGVTVLSKCITEGAADFVAYLLLNKIILPRQHAYGNAHAQELFARFLKAKDSTDLSFWMYNQQMEEKGIPSDLGYYVGFKICQAYYDRQADKKKAVRDILERTDFENLLRESGYGASF